MDVNIRPQKRENFVHFCDFAVFGIKTSSSDKGSMDILDTFWLLYFVKKMWKYLFGIRDSENCIDPKFYM